MELWNPLSKIYLSKGSFTWNKRPVKSAMTIKLKSNLHVGPVNILTWDPIWLNGMGNHEAAGGYRQNEGVLVVLVFLIFDTECVQKITQQSKVKGHQ